MVASEILSCDLPQDAYSVQCTPILVVAIAIVSEKIPILKVTSYPIDMSMGRVTRLNYVSHP